MIADSNSDKMVPSLRQGTALPRRKRQRGDSNPCGQSPMDFESISLTARTQCLADSQRNESLFRLQAASALLGLFGPQMQARLLVERRARTHARPPNLTSRTLQREFFAKVCSQLGMPTAMIPLSWEGILAKMPAVRAALLKNVHVMLEKGCSGN